MLIRNTQLNGRAVDLHIAGGRIVQIGANLAVADAPVWDARGAQVLPGLHDHHLHLRALAAARASLRCGPPQVRTADQLAAAIQKAARAAPGAWLRGIGYHESVAGELTRAQLDAWLPNQPLRIQHRSGRLWIFNSAAIAELKPETTAPLDARSGRLLDADDWLRARMASQLPDLSAISRALAAHGITGVTDTTHHNGLAALRGFAEARARGELLQHVRVMGNAELDTAADLPLAQRGEHKFHLHDHDLPDFEALVAAIARSHAHDRGVAFHAVTRGELVFALAALTQAGARAQDRIEHAAIVPPELLEQIAALGVTVVTQPHFIAERGDDYLRDVDADDQPWLYRLQSLIDAGVPLALSSDAPFGQADPWAGMRAAVQRKTPAGQVIGAAEALDRARALAGYLSPLEAPGARARQVEIGARADLCFVEPLEGAQPQVVRTLIEGAVAFRAR
ncbi:amidohydrolase family protein [Sinimarinibacterium sp. NLF-5-8]|uniref:amidohydrolase family protein n=1 Tax=Sinimarinibacterium sp. NLF-5-8 TaxID=2698684 RepID=UPI00137BCC8E|nr:amidohydrolase family protein [Sinimarinibacterium sp. NLF-5-8]QHS09329.1 amidohydrolase family protein [Sinimarinibacterium sp. NLF-5-8]